MQMGMRRTRNLKDIFKRILLGAVALASVAVVVIVILQKYSHMLSGDRPLPLAEDVDSSRQSTMPPTKPLDLCMIKKSCPKDHFSFSIVRQATNVVEPRICLDNVLVLDKVMNNAGSGINIVVINGRTGEVVKTGHFNMYDGDVQDLIDFLQSIEEGSAVLMASYDDPATNKIAPYLSVGLNDEAKKLIGELGSSDIQSFTFRDNWVFAGGKGAKTSFEKHLKNDVLDDKYYSEPEMIKMEGCIPKYQE